MVASGGFHPSNEYLFVTLHRDHNIPEVRPHSRTKIIVVFILVR